jgi:methylated-DNA-[protein]-cysteine S-methyltransferase
LNEPSYKQLYISPVGPLGILSNGSAITSIIFLNDNIIEPSECSHDAIIPQCIKQFDEYFEGTRQTFDIPLCAAGTEFQNKVWRKVSMIPYGETTSYRAIAVALGDPKLNRAVGLANGANPIPIIIPCHRVIGGDGSLTGYAGGLDRKKWLLNHEKRFYILKKGQLKLF